jgi:hypothetical protein
MLAAAGVPPEIAPWAVDGLSIDSYSLTRKSCAVFCQYFKALNVLGTMRSKGWRSHRWSRILGPPVVAFESRSAMSYRQRFPAIGSHSGNQWMFRVFWKIEHRSRPSFFS